MTTDILVLPFRRTHAVSLSGAIRQYISTKYYQHADIFTSDLAEIDKLRKAAVNVLEPHVSGIPTIEAYSAQLAWMGGKFPIDIGAEFIWYPALGYHTDTPISQNNVRFELANVLFNLAALYCQLAVNSNRSTSEGLKIASNYFCYSAGVISHLKSTVIPEMRSTAPEDMDAITLECLEQLLLAQAQECFWQKAVKDSLKDASIAKLAAKVSDLYSQAADFGIKSDVISSEWIHHMTAKHHHFAAAAQYRAACDCLEKRRYGEEVARLRDSLACVSEALKESRYLNKIVLNDLNALKNKVQQDMKRAEKDNDMIYLLPVPPKTELKLLDRASMVVARVPKQVADPLSTFGDQGGLMKPLFAKLVPHSVHVAASIYVSRRDECINAIIDELENLTARVHDLLRSLNLPGSLQAVEKPLGLPASLLSHAEEIRQQNGPQRLHRSMDDIANLKNADRTIYQEGINWLQSEGADDEQARKRYGTERWRRPTSSEAGSALYAQMNEQAEYFKAADASDNNVKQKVDDNEPMVRVLNGTDRDLERLVPNSARVAITPQVDCEISRLRGALNEVHRLESRRRRRIEALRAKAQGDDINPALLKEAARLEQEWPMQKIEAVQFEDFFDKRLQRYEGEKEDNKHERQEQEKVLSRLAEANTSFMMARRGDTSTKEREEALQKLENAYFAYKDIIQNLDVGRKFYNDLATLVTTFRDDCRAFAYQRRSEAAQLESDINTSLSMANLNLNQVSADERERKRWQDHVEGHNPPSDNTPLAAPLPVKPPVSAQRRYPAAVLAEIPASGVWNPDMPIRFARAS